METFYLKEKF